MDTVITDADDAAETIERVPEEIIEPMWCTISEYTQVSILGKSMAKRSIRRLIENNKFWCRTRMVSENNTQLYQIELTSFEEIERLKVRRKMKEIAGKKKISLRKSQENALKYQVLRCRGSLLFFRLLHDPKFKKDFIKFILNDEEGGPRQDLLFFKVLLPAVIYEKLKSIKSRQQTLCEVLLAYYNRFVRTDIGSVYVHLAQKGLNQRANFFSGSKISLLTTSEEDELPKLQD